MCSRTSTHAHYVVLKRFRKLLEHLIKGILLEKNIVLLGETKPGDAIPGGIKSGGLNQLEQYQVVPTFQGGTTPGGAIPGEA